MMLRDKFAQHHT